MSERPLMLPIEKITDEAEGIKSFWFSHDLKSKPGQFLMLWIPEAGQKPFGVSYQTKGMFAVTVRDVGDFTHRMFSMKPGDRIGVQGPYGNGFSGKGKRVALVGGGYGTAPIAFLADEMSKSGKTVFLITGAVTEKYILYRKRFSKGRVKASYSTDDGSFGAKGFCTDCLSGMIKAEKIDMIYCCGPEVMMKKVLGIARDAKVPAELSLERYMKCGFGVCGSCVLEGTGWRVCKDGPVFTSEQMSKVRDFGSAKRDATGKKVRV